MRGVRLVSEAVRPTYGPKGKDAVLGAFEWPYSIATNDGASIAERVKSDDPFEQMGVRLMQESIGRANKTSGDGSTLTTILTSALLEEGPNFSGESSYKESLNQALPIALDAVDKQTKEVAPEDVWKVAAVSAQDEGMGKMIGDIYKQIGKDGVIAWEQSHSEDTNFEIKPGIELRGVSFLTPTMINANAKGPVMDPTQGDRIVMNNAHILMSAEKITSAAQLEPYAQALQRQGINEMVLFCDEIEPIALAEITATSLGMNMLTGQPLRNGAFKIVVLKAPSMWKDWVYEDMALMTGATVFGVGQQAQFKAAASLSWLGNCDSIIAKRGSTDLIGTRDISEHIATLMEAAKDRQEFEKRVEWLNSKSAVVKMGARSEVELTYKRLKFDDAKNAAKLALQGGIVLGGGATLASITTGNELLDKALRAPAQQMEVNGTPVSPDKLRAEGIYDPALVVKNAISAAVSVAGTVLDCETLIPHETA